MENGLFTTAAPKHKLRWHQFSLRTLLVAVTLFAIPCSWLAVKIHEAVRQRKAVAAIIEEGGTVRYNYDYLEFNNGVPVGEPKRMNWLRDALGEDLISNVVWAHIGNDAGLEHVKDLSSLQTLSLNRSQVTDAGLKCLAGMDRLQLIDLESTKFAAAGMEYLEKLPRLQWLNLSKTQMQDSDLRHLIKFAKLPKLALADNPITDAGLEYLKELRNLEWLWLQNTKVTDEGVEKLQRALPKCKIIR